ncbi:MAG: two component, sigma54 specific, transcriptional regulator, Fis family [Candidatus Binatus sp.]|nr:two component, sigma54 specific, transcriptional regulator, Fis family [Candidatus Binatus sp.]
MANILVVDDDRNIRRVLAASLESSGHQVEVAESAEQALEKLAGSIPKVVVSDVRMAGLGGFKLLETIKHKYPTLPVVMMTAFGSIPDAVDAMRHGAYDYITKPFNADHIRQIVARALELQELRAENKDLRDQIESLTEPDAFLAYSTVTRKLAETAAQIAASDATALITGESGTGKSLLAGYIHRLSPRKLGPFVQVACTTLSEHLLESELFGHVRGSFTGAIKDKPGRLEAAEGGTVLLDEIGDLTPVVQSKLLRFLQERTFERVGGAQTIKVDARIIAATNQNLEQLVKEKRFREDLYYRLNVIELTVPALRDRPGEALKLAEHFTSQAALLHHKKVQSLEPEARDALASYSWPGNIRELRNVMQRAVILSRGETITLSDLPDKILATPGKIDHGLTLEQMERKHIEVVLEQAVTLEEAAEMLGINVATLWRKRRRYGLD